MKKLTAGIFAGILTIVTVNAADAAIASKAYVDQKHDVNAGEISTLKTTVGEHTTSITNLRADIDTLSGTGDGSVAKQIADKLGAGFPADSTVQAQLALKANQAALDATNANVAKNADAITTLNGEGEGSVKKQIGDAITEVNTAAGNLSGRVTANEGAIKTLRSDLATAKTDITDITKEDGTINTRIEAAKTEIKNTTDDLGERVTTAEGEIDTLQTDLDAAELKITNLTNDKADKTNVYTKTEIDDKVSTINTEIGTKQTLLDGTNVVKDGEGNVVTAVSATNGVVTATMGSMMPAVPATAKGETGSFVLTATVKPDGTLEYYWEDITRKLAE